MITQFVLGNQAADLPIGIERLKLLATHKALGMTVLMLMALRILWRLTNAAPALPPARTKTLARLTHHAFYALLLAVPLSGWLLSSASNLSVSYFQLFTFPDLISADPELTSSLKLVHETLNLVLAGLAITHIAAAFLHHFHYRDEVLLRMLPGPRLLNPKPLEKESS